MSDDEGPAGRAGPGDEIDADADIVEGNQPPSARVSLSRERIVGVAVSFIDEHGLPGLSMRKLGGMLGVEAMSLYRYVPGKDDLLDAVVESLIDELERDPEVYTTPRDGWQDFLARLAHGVRRVALAHPKGFPLIASRPAEAPWLRPPLRSLDWVERFLDALITEGFSDESAVAGYRAFTSFLLGHLLLQVSSQGADLGPLDVHVEAEEPDGLHQWPAVRRLQRALAEDHAATEFEEALEALLERMSLLLLESGGD